MPLFCLQAYALLSALHTVLPMTGHANWPCQRAQQCQDRIRRHFNYKRSEEAWAHPAKATSRSQLPPMYASLPEVVRLVVWKGGCPRIEAYSLGNMCWPPRIRSRVVLPAPFAPTSSSRSPACSLRFTSRRMGGPGEPHTVVTVVSTVSSCAKCTASYASSEEVNGQNSSKGCF